MFTESTQILSNISSKGLKRTIELPMFVHRGFNDAYTLKCIFFSERLHETHTVSQREPGGGITQLHGE